jgi:hypothetical protein
MRTLIALACLSINLSSSGYATAQVTPTTTASIRADVETVYTLPDGRETRSVGHFYRSRNGVTREDSKLGAVITDVAAGTITILISETKEARVMTIPVEHRVRPAQASGPRPEVFEEKAMKGHQIAKARMKGPQGEKVEFWTAKDLGVVTWTKTEAGGFTTTRELQNLSTEEPSAALFQIPDDYTIITQEMRLDGAKTMLPKGRAPNR